MHKKEVSYGIIPLRKFRNKWQVLLVQHGKGHWAFPKGHAEEGETPQQTAERELKEETGLHVTSFLDMPTQTEHYFFRSGSTLIEKNVLYFVAQVSGQLSPQEEEISDCKWIFIEKAHALATFPATQELCENVRQYLLVY